jgi:putative transposase
MPRPFGPNRPLDTIWEVSDPLWERIEPILLADAPPARTGRPRGDWRRILNGIIFRMRTGCQWNKLPAEFGDDSTIHRWFQRWCKSGVMQRIWAALVAECDELQGVRWEWQSADGSLGKARFGGTLSARTPRIAARTAPSGA